MPSLTVATPFGPLYLETHGLEIVTSEFRPRARPSAGAVRDPLLREARAQISAYCRKRLRRFDLPWSAPGTPFQLAVWQRVAALETGEIISYADVARAIGAPRAHRGVAMAMGRTPLDLLIPAHRVVGADGRVKGAGPNALRRRLLLHEGIRLR
jgi:O-6-methylguanine DNA methyltransferase